MIIQIAGIQLLKCGNFEGNSYVDGSVIPARDAGIQFFISKTFYSVFVYN
ncbi:hypothetical protein wVul_0018 [Wolbachia endosymbiont of Armadillidium vulgare str. wVulC]|nr:hypothetical protein wVul_0018 [Wolbachia endosymbiont of Armadillidium vulgare str. wVulC]